MSAEWPKFLMARDLADYVFPVSETVILQTARKHGVGRKFGRAIIFSVDDINRFYELLPCPSVSSVARARLSGSSAALSGESALKKARALATSALQKKSEPSAKPSSYSNRSTVVPLQQPSRRRS